MRVLSFSGSPQAMGEAFGETCRDQIPILYQNRLANALRQARQHGGREVGEEAMLTVARACLAPTRAHDPSGYAELEGIARGSGQPVEKILAMNGLTDIRDVLSWAGDLEALGGCTSFVVGADQTHSGELLCGQSWDLATDNMPFVVAVHRKPDDGPETWTLTTVGCLSLIGLNEHGIAVGTTNVRTTDARPGVTYLSMIHRALASRTLDEAAAAIAGAQRAGAHFFYVADGDGRALALECTPEMVDRRELGAGTYVHTNHCVVPAHQAIEGDTPSESSHFRQARLEQLIAASAEPGVTITMETAQGWLADRDNGHNAISRADFNGINTNGAVVMQPQSRAIHVCHGPPHEATWFDLRAAVS